MKSDNSVPGSDELEDLILQSSRTSGSISPFSDDYKAQQQLYAESKRLKRDQGVVVQYRAWSTNEVFHSDGIHMDSAEPVDALIMASSPPPSPLKFRKRKFPAVDLGRNTLARPAKAQRVYYGIDIHQLLEEAQDREPFVEQVAQLPTPPAEPASKKSSLLWTEKYRARKFTDLIGDERTHRAVMHWLKRWDHVVFPGSQRPSAKAKGPRDEKDERPFKKILMLTGPPGLGKTTLAHVCAKQAGYEVQEINASDERSSAVVKGRIRDMLGTENVRGVDNGKGSGDKVRKPGKPVCVVVDEVDGVVSGSGGGGEGGFISAILDLLTLDQKSSSPLTALKQAPVRKKKGDKFCMRRPLILICNDIYHPSLRLLRKSAHAEVIHVRKAPVQGLISRIHSILGKEGIPCELDGVRRLCEATWGFSGRKEDRNAAGPGEGDMRQIMVVAEWAASKLRAVNEKADSIRLTRRWVEDNILRELANSGGARRGVGSGGSKDLVDRVFDETAGFPKTFTPLTPPPQQQRGDAQPTVGVADALKRIAGERLRELIDTHGDSDRLVTDCFSVYPERPFQDDTILSKPDAAYDWLHFHDCLSTAVHQSSEWELAPYLSTPVLAFHHLFSSSTSRAHYTTTATDADQPAEDDQAHSFTGSQASWAAHEAAKHNESTLQNLQASLSQDLTRIFNSPSVLATDLLPYLLRMLSPNVNPVIVGGTDRTTASVRKASEQQLVARSVRAMTACGVTFDRTRVQADETAPTPGAGYSSSQWIYRMEPSLDELGEFSTGGKALAGLTGITASKTRYAVRQVLHEEWKREEKRRAEAARLARAGGERYTNHGDVHATVALNLEGKKGETGASRRDEAASKAVKKDFFGRPLVDDSMNSGKSGKRAAATANEGRVWVTYHEGYSNAVRKPITLAELMKDL